MAFYAMMPVEGSMVRTRSPMGLVKFEVLTCIFLLLAMGPHANSQTPSSGANTLESLKTRAAAGAAQDQLDYAKALKDIDPKESRVWAQKAADQNLAEAWYWLGYTSNEGRFSNYKKAAELGYADAYEPIFDELLFRAAKQADVVEAKHFADLAISQHISLGYSGDIELETINRCYEAGEASIPVQDQIKAEEIQKFSTKKCQIFRAKKKRDLTSYASCILSQQPSDNNHIAELYANGWGVKRNAMLAIAFACHGSQVPAELQDIVKELYEGRGNIELEDEFTFCSHATSKINQRRCSLEE